MNTEIMTTEEAAEYLKVSKQFIVKLAKEKKLPATKIGRCWRFSRPSLEQWISKRLRVDEEMYTN